MNIAIRRERPEDASAIASLNDGAFGGPDESALIQRLREDEPGALSLVAISGEEIVGHLLLSELSLQIDGRKLRALALAPMAVAPARQRTGIGSRLVSAAIEEARKESWKAIIVLGHPNFYTRFGFSPELARKLDAPFSGDAFMALELEAGALEGERGAVVYPAAFGVVAASRH